MKKVLFVATVTKTHILTFHIPFLKWFKDNGFEVHVCAKNDFENANECYIPYCDKFYDLPFERSPFKIINFKVEKELRNILKENQYNLIHCHTPMGGALARIANKKIANSNAKIVYTAHGFHFFEDSPKINWLLYYPIEKYLSNFTDLLVTINKDDYELSKRKFLGVKTVYVPGVGIDLNKFKKERNDDIIQVMKKELGIRKNDIVLLSVGELNKNKNHATIIKALSEKEFKNFNFKYLICGKGPEEDNLKKLIQDKKLENVVTLLGYQNDISKFYNLSDLFIFPSLREGLSLALMEAMASKLPVICSNIRGNRDLIDDGLGGYLCEAKDIESYKNAILKLLNSGGNFDFGEYNVSKLKDFSLEKVIEEMANNYEELMK